MNYRRSVELTVRDAARNSLGILLVSLLFSLTLLPFSSTIFFDSLISTLIGLWTTCLLAGCVLVAGFRLTTEIAARNTSISTAPLWTGIREDWPTGIVVGILSFGVALVSLGLFSVSLSGLIGQSISLFGVYLLIGWPLLLGFTLSIYGRLNGSEPRTLPVESLQFAFRAGLDTFVQNPSSTLWLLVQAAGWTFIAVITLVTPVLLLPGFLVLLAAEITEMITSWDDVDEASPARIRRFGPSHSMDVREDLQVD